MGSRWTQAHWTVRASKQEELSLPPLRQPKRSRACSRAFGKLPWPVFKTPEELSKTSMDDPAIRSSVNNAFVNAALLGRVDLVDKMCGALVTDVDGRNSDAWTALHAAVSEEHLAVAHLLLTRGASPEARSPHSLTALHIAAARANTAMVELLCRHGADVNAQGPLGKTALHLALDAGASRVVSSLLDHGARADTIDGDGDTVLLQACMAGDEDMVFRIVEKLDELGVSDAKQALVNQPRASDGMTPLHVAARRGDLGLVIALLHHGADLESANVVGHSPLFCAALQGSEDVIQFLLESGACVEATEIQGCTSLIAAAKSGHAAAVHLLLEHGANVDHRNQEGCTALHAAAVDGHVGIAEVLLQRGANLESRRRNGWTPLLTAAAYNQANVVRLLIDKGADVNAGSYDEWTPLTKAVQNGHTTVCRLLLEEGASIESRTAQSLTALHLATVKGRVDIVELLCLNGASVDACETTYGKTALHMALDGGFMNIVLLLLAHDASVNVVGKNGNTAFMEACLMGNLDFVARVVESRPCTKAKFDLVNAYRALDKSTPLLVAAGCGHFELVVFLAYHGADINARNVLKHTPLSAAAVRGHDDVVQFLVENGADVNATEMGGATPLMGAVKYGLAGVVDMLLDYGAEIEHREQNGCTSLIAAVEVGQTRTVQTLIDRGADCNAREQNGWTPLLFAAQSGQVEIVQALINHGANVNCRSDDQRTPLSVAAYLGHTEICEVLLNHHAPTNVQDLNGRTSLHHAAAGNHCEIIELLLSSDADPTRRDFLGQTAAHVAMTEGHFTTAEFLDAWTGGKESVDDNQVWPLRCLLELYGASDKAEQSTAKVALEPAWYIDPASVTLIKERESLSTNVADVEVATWSGSRVLIVKPKPGRNHEDQIEMRQSFAKEVSRLFQLRHPHVAKLYGACHRGERPFLVMEHPQNDTLRSFIADNQQQTWATLHQLALGLQYLHERGIRHERLRGDNIRVGDDGLVKLSGFGVYSGAHFRDQLLWEPPEMVAENYKLLSSDIYSLGMCIIEAVTGDVPYADKDSQEIGVKRMKLNGQLMSKPLEFPSRAWDLVMRMTCLQPNMRLSLSDVVRELAALASEEQRMKSQRHEMDCHGEISVSDEQFVRLRSTAAALLDKNSRLNRSGDDETPHRHLLHRLEGVWQQSLMLPDQPRGRVQQHTQELCARFVDDLQSQQNVREAASFAAQRQEEDRMFSFHNEIDRLVESLDDLLVGHGLVMAPVLADTIKWRERWRECRRERLRVFAKSLEHVETLDVETATCLLFELARRRDAYASISPTEIHEASVTLRSMTGVHLPDWFIPHYEVQFDEYRNFSKGAFGSVHHGEWMGARVVVKKVFADDGGEFEEEVEVWSMLYHPNVLQLYGASHVGQKFIVSEFAAGGQLDKYLERLSPQPKRRQRELWRTLHEAALGLQYLHLRGIIHCDLKCNNILIGRDGKAKVSDYGLSRRRPEASCELASVDGQTSTEGSTGKTVATVGAPRWKAPEILNGAEPTVQSDVYGFGMCIVEAVTGEYPWGTRVPDENVSDHVKKGKPLFDKPPSFTDRQWGLVVGACSLDPSERLTLPQIIEMLDGFAKEARNDGDDDKDVGSSVGSARCEPEPEATQERHCGSSGLSWSTRANAVDEVSAGKTVTTTQRADFAESWGP